VTRDPKDDAVVACAQEGEADYIVSGDQDLLVLEEYGDVQIVSPREFLEILERDRADSLTPNRTG
jgi:predicted nucleic acid-binding protein